MAFKLGIKNIGKLTDAKIEIGQFTVFAGPNNTGKSFVSKVLYSLFNAMNANHAEVHIKNLTRSIRNRLDILTGLVGWREFDESSPAYSFLNEIRVLEDLATESPIGNFEALDKIILELANRVQKMPTMLPDVLSALESMKNKNGVKVELDQNFREEICSEIEKSLKTLHETLSDINAKGFIAAGIEHKIRENLFQNFQTPKLSDLSNKEDIPSEVNMEDFGKFEFSNGEIGFNIESESAGFQQLQEYSRVIYLESPIYWKLKPALEGIRLSPRFHFSRRARLSGVPGYFYDLALALREEYTGDMDFPNLYERLTGKEVINGKIALSESGDLLFQENGRSCSLPVAAMGVVNLGILALLIERKVLDEGSFIFIDEPEAHLHPAWQVIMAEILFELAKGGVNVVIATHSADILKWLEVHVKKNPDNENMIALNKFPANGDEADKLSFKDKIAEIKEELTKPFADLFTAGL